MPDHLHHGDVVVSVADRISVLRGDARLLQEHLDPAGFILALEGEVCRQTARVLVEHHRFLKGGLALLIVRIVPEYKVDDAGMDVLRFPLGLQVSGHAVALVQRFDLLRWDMAGPSPAVPNKIVPASILVEILHKFPNLGGGKEFFEDGFPIHNNVRPVHGNII